MLDTVLKVKNFQMVNDSSPPESNHPRRLKELYLNKRLRTHKRSFVPAATTESTFPQVITDRTIINHESPKKQLKFYHPSQQPQMHEHRMQSLEFLNKNQQLLPIAKKSQPHFNSQSNCIIIQPAHLQLKPTTTATVRHLRAKIQATKPGTRERLEVAISPY